VDKWSSLAGWGWILVALALGYAVGIIHGFFKHWFSGKVYCPRCLYYLNWRDTMLREVLPDWFMKARARDPWDRDNPPAGRLKPRVRFEPPASPPTIV